MRKDLKDPIDVNPAMLGLGFEKFKAMVKKDHPNDKLTPEQRWVKTGGKPQK